jgi:hypothetical protein
VSGDNGGGRVRLLGPMPKRRCSRCDGGFTEAAPAWRVDDLLLHNDCWRAMLADYVGSLPAEVQAFIEGWRLAVETWGRASARFHHSEAVMELAEQAMALWRAGEAAGKGGGYVIGAGGAGAESKGPP